ncbi:MAG: catalase, partial [Clostridia bacterium]|nr:catalase [Clostridia bacterium]
MERCESEPPQTRPDPYGDELPILHAQTVGPCGPVVLQDQVLHESLSEFVHAKTVERAVHVKGWGAFGHFENSRSMSEYTMLPFLQSPGTRVSVVSRFSLAVSNQGTPDTSRNVRGFSTKFYTKDGPF